MSKDPHVMFDINPKIGTDACYREWDNDPENPGWFCVNDHTGCMWNAGNNTCYHEGEDESPLEKKEGGCEYDPVGENPFPTKNKGEEDA